MLSTCVSSLESVPPHTHHHLTFYLVWWTHQDYNTRLCRTYLGCDIWWLALAAIGSLLTLTPLALHILTVPLYPVISMHRVKCNNCMCTERKAYSFNSLCVRADKEGMLHMCIRVAVCAGLCRCVVVKKVWAWRHWMDLECGCCRGRHERRRRRKKKLGYSLKVMDRSPHG